MAAQAASHGGAAVAASARITNKHNRVRSSSNSNSSSGGVVAASRGTPQQRSRRSTVVTAAAAPPSNLNPLSEEEAAELTLLTRAGAITRDGRGLHLANAAYNDLIPSEVSVVQQKAEYWDGQAAEYERQYNNKKYGNVLAQFEGEVVVDASAEVCYWMWSAGGADMFKSFIPGLAVARPMPDGRCWEVLMFYQFADSGANPLEELRFMTHVYEAEENKMIHYQSTDGFPNGVVLTFDELEPATPTQRAKTRVKMDFYCHLPYDLAKKEGAMAVSMDVETLVTDCLENFSEKAREVVLESIITGDKVEGMSAGASFAASAAARSRGDSSVNKEMSEEEEAAAAAAAAADYVVIAAGELPTFKGGDEEGSLKMRMAAAGVDGSTDVYLSGTRLKEAAAEFEARVGRKPLNVEIVKQVVKGMRRDWKLEQV
mmetsp:Transcript_15526/g.37602  ORF Transcript_15526/g.37602 Transcript_15526/m.37602 type:complete len:429 (-) Transcript_15526:81-1367(-)